MRNITSSVATFLNVSGITEYWSGVLWSLSLGITSKSCQFRPQLPIVKRKRGLLFQLFASIKTCSLQTSWVWMQSWYEELLISSGRCRFSEGARKTVGFDRPDFVPFISWNNSSKCQVVFIFVQGSKSRCMVARRRGKLRNYNTSS